MRVTRLRLREFRTYATAEFALGAGLTVVHGPNGAGKTNLLEGLYFACTGRSCRTTNEREVIRHGARVARVEVSGVSEDGPHELAVGIEAGRPRAARVDGVPVARMVDAPQRPLVCVFLPDRLELVKGPPAVRRAHLDALVAALWPARRATRTAYGQALVQRNALLARVRAGAAGAAALDAWDTALATHGVALIADRRAAVELLRGPLAAHAQQLSLDGAPAVEYRPSSEASATDELVAELATRRDTDVRRGVSGHGPHRDVVALLRGGRDLRPYGSQGQQRLAVLSLLLAEREVLEQARGAPPLLLLDDVLSELDAERRERLLELLRSAGQSVITTTDLAHVPGAGAPGVAHLELGAQVALDEASAA